MGKLRQGSHPHAGQLSESEEKHLRLRVKHLIWNGNENGMRMEWNREWNENKWNENQTIFVAAIHMPGRNAGLLEEAVVGSWSLGIEEQS